MPGARAATIHVPADKPTIQAAINAASNGDTVLVAKGTYKENIDFLGKAITVMSADGSADTVIQGDGTTAVVQFHNNETLSSVLKGFLIRGGGGYGDAANPVGGGVFVTSASPEILDNEITANQCHGVDLEGSGALVEGNIVSDTTPAGRDVFNCDSPGTAVYVGGVSPGQPPQLIGNEIIDNSDGSEYGGGGVQLWGAEGTVIESNSFIDNVSAGEGGGIVAFNTDAMIIAQNLFYGNAAGYGGGGISLHPPDATQGPFIGLIQNNTFVWNSVTLIDSQISGPSGSQVYLEGNLGQYEFTDNIVIGDDANPAFVCGTTYNYLSITPLVIDHNDIYNSHGPGYGGACPDQTGQYGNIAADPLFVKPNPIYPGDFHLLSGSPAIDAGNNSALELLALAGYPLSGDLDGNPREQDATGKGYPVIDMGAYEYAGTHTASPTMMVLTPNAYYIGGQYSQYQSLTLTAALYSALGTPGGTVTFFEDGAQVGTAAIGGLGAAVLQLGSSIKPGTHAFLATYPGEGSFTPCESVKIYVLVSSYGVTLTLASNPNPSLVGQSVTFSMTINSGNGVPPGQVTLKDLTTNTTLATLTPDATGKASFSTSALAAGTHTIQASYPGNADYLSASASIQQTVNGGGTPTTTAVVSSRNPAPAGSSITFTATVSSLSARSQAPAGTVTFTDTTKSTTLGSVTLAGGTGAVSTSALAVGSHKITATFNPAASWEGSSGSLVQVIDGLPTTTALTAGPNPAYATHAVTLTAHVTSTASGTPTGTVTFFSAGSVLGSAPLAANGTASAVVKFAAASTTPYAITASYSGDSEFNQSTSAPFEETIQLNPTSTVILSISPNPVGAYQQVTLQAKVSSATSPAGTPTGTVAFTAPGVTVGWATLKGGTATLQVNAVAAASYLVTAAYEGDPAFAASKSATETLDVTPEVPAIAMSSSVNPVALGFPVTFTAKITAPGTGTPLKGTVTFEDGGSPLGAAVQAVNGSASITTSSLTLGKHAITAAFSGNASVQAATSPALDETVVAYTGDFTLKVSPGSGSVYTGAAATAVVTTTAENGFNLPLSLGCSGLPDGAACAFSPTSVAGANGKATVIISTQAPQHAVSAAPAQGAAIALAGLFGLLFLPRRRRAAWLCLALVFVLAAFSGCSGSGSLSGGTAPGVYPITISATTTGPGPQLAHSQTFTLTVKSLF